MLQLQTTALDSLLIIVLLVLILITVGLMAISMLRSSKGEDTEMIDFFLVWAARLVGSTATPETIGLVAGWVYDHFGGSELMTRDQFVAYAISVITSIIDDEVSVRELLPDDLSVESL